MTAYVSLFAASFLAATLMPFWWFALLTATGKGGRYAVLIDAVTQAAPSA